MTEIVTSASLTRDLIETGHKLRSAIDTARETSAEYVRLKHEYQLAWDNAFLAAVGTEQTKKSTANVKTADLAKLSDLALEKKRIARLEVDAFQSIVSAYQTIGATARAEMRLAGSSY